MTVTRNIQSLRPGICTSASRPANPYAGMEIFETDTVRNMRYTTSWIPFGLHTCTSSTRPTAINGLEIYETDTFRTLLYDGTGWVIMNEPMQTSTAALFGGFTGGTPTYATRYLRQNGMMWVYSSLTFGGTPSAVTDFTYSPPVNGLNIEAKTFNVHFLDNGVQRYDGMNNAGTTALPLRVWIVNATYSTVGGMALTVPFTWGVGDQILVTGWFEMTTRYS